MVFGTSTYDTSGHPIGAIQCSILEAKFRADESGGLRCPPSEAVAYCAGQLPLGLPFPNHAKIHECAVLEQGFIAFSGAAQQLDATLCTARTLEKFDPITSIVGFQIKFDLAINK